MEKVRAETQTENKGEKDHFQWLTTLQDMPLI